MEDKAYAVSSDISAAKVCVCMHVYCVFGALSLCPIWYLVLTYASCPSRHSRTGQACHGQEGAADRVQDPQGPSQRRHWR